MGKGFGMKQPSTNVSMGNLRTPTGSARRFTSLARAVLRLRFGGRELRGHAQVAHLLGVSVASVKRIEERALRQLRLAALEPSSTAASAASGPAQGAMFDELQSILADLAHNEWEEV